jgi:hypothetical protein
VVEEGALSDLFLVVGSPLKDILHQVNSQKMTQPSEIVS